MPDWVLPYPAQLPQDYYSKGLEPAPSTPDTPATPTPTPIPDEPTGTQSQGGAYYGDTPPDNPSYGWLWTDTQGRLFVYMEPGIWSQIATNW
jgi:hypothetical protein